MVVQHVEPWMSEADIESGGRWNDRVAAELEKADYGIICLTTTNLDRPWLLFEAGALAKRFETARVVPLLVDLKPADVTMPLATFQGRELNKEGMRRLVRDVGALRKPPMSNEQIDALFDGMWDRLEAEVEFAIIDAATQPARHRSTADMLSEIVESVRRIERYVSDRPPPALADEGPEEASESVDLLAQLRESSGESKSGATVIDTGGLRTEHLLTLVALM
jgi:hypothetical protein